MNNDNPENNNDNPNTKTSILTIRINQEEKQMINTLRHSPYWINIPQYVRDTIKHLHDSKINKAGRPK